jgi:tripartite-type tricarboxylate transporter receptor subunit TctC
MEWSGPALYKLDYDPLKDFSPVAIVAESLENLTVNLRVPANSLAETRICPPYDSL